MVETSETFDEIEVLRDDGDTLAMNGTANGVFKKPNEISFGGFLNAIKGV